MGHAPLSALSNSLDHMKPPLVSFARQHRYMSLVTCLHASSHLRPQIQFVSISLSPSLTCTTTLNHTPGSFKLQAHAAVITRIEAISGTQIDLGLRLGTTCIIEHRVMQGDKGRLRRVRDRISMPIHQLKLMENPTVAIISTKSGQPNGGSGFAPVITWCKYGVHENDEMVCIKLLEMVQLCGNTIHALWPLLVQSLFRMEEMVQSLCQKAKTS